MDREMIDKNVAILELIADFKIAVTQLQEDCKQERTRVDMAKITIDNLRTKKDCAEIKIDRALICLKDMLKEDTVITKEGIENCIGILENTRQEV